MGDNYSQPLDQAQFDPSYSQEQQPATQQQMSLPYGSLPPKYQMDTRWQYEADDVMTKIENFLRGRIKDVQTGEYKQIYIPLMNSEGINLLMGDLAMTLHKGIFLSNLSKDDVIRLAKENRTMLINWLGLNWYKHKVDKSNLQRIVVNIDRTIYCALMKPFNDLERKHHSNIHQESVTTSIVQEPHKRRFGIF